MTSVAQATDIILSQVRDFGAETVPLRHAGGRVLRTPILADRDFPPYTRVAMDGIAICHARFAAGQRTFVLQGVQGAGQPPLTLTAAGACIEVMTGAVLPAGADTVVPYEEVDISDGVAVIRTERVAAGQNAHPRGADRRQGAVLIEPGRPLSPADIGIAATVGVVQLPVARLPRTLILYTGDELVDAGQQPLPHQIRASNPYTIAATLAPWGIEADLRHLPDEEALVRRQLRDGLKEYDLIILSGGVSKGRFDFVPDALRELTVDQLLYGVQQRPGKSFWFGAKPGGATVFALPGNPVPALCCTLRYIVPWLRQCLGLPPFDRRMARLAEPVAFRKPQTLFLEVSTHLDAQEQRWATPTAGQGSGDLANLARCDGFLELPPDSDVFAAGQTFPWWPFR